MGVVSGLKTIFGEPMIRKIAGDSLDIMLNRPIGMLYIFLIQIVNVISILLSVVVIGLPLYFGLSLFIDSLGTKLLIIVIPIILLMFCLSQFFAALRYKVILDTQENRGIRFDSLLQFGKQKWLNFLLMTVIKTTLILVVFVLPIVLFIVSPPLVSLPPAISGLLFFVVLMVLLFIILLLYLYLFFSEYLLAMHSIGPIESLKRSFGIVNANKGSSFKYFVLVFFVITVYLVMYLVLSIVPLATVAFDFIVAIPFDFFLDLTAFSFLKKLGSRKIFP